MKTTLAILILAVTTFFGCAKQESSPNTSGNTRADSMAHAIKLWADLGNKKTVDISVLDSIFSQDMIEHKSLTDRSGKLEIGWVEGLKRLFKDPLEKNVQSSTYTIEEIISQGDICAVRFHEKKIVLIDSAGTMVPKVKLSVDTYWLRWKNGKFIEYWDSRKETL